MQRQSNTFHKLCWLKKDVQIRNYLSCLLLDLSSTFLVSQITRATYPDFFNPVNYKDYFHPLFVLVCGYIKVLSKQQFILELTGGFWFFFLVFFSILALAAYIYTHKSLVISKSKQVNVVSLLVGLTLMGHLILVVVVAYFFWEEYVIQLSPLILIWLAYISRKVEVSKIRAVMIIFLMLLFSLQITRNRYQDIGVHWELGTRMVEEFEINPINISEANWAWRPWWFFESTFEEKVKKAGGKKYKVAQIGGGWNVLKPEGQIYQIEEVRLNQVLGEEIILESEPYWVFWQKKKMVVKKLND